MELTTRNLVLDADSGIDMQMHTTNSDGTWTPDELIAYLVGEGFGMAAITDHDRVDRTAALQGLAAEKGLPLMVAAEMSTDWRGKQVDTLCFGFDPTNAGLLGLTANILAKQRANSEQAYAYFLKHGYHFEGEAVPLETILALPAARQPHALAALLNSAENSLDLASVWMVMESAGVKFAKNPIAEVVDTVHASGGVCLIAHPGRGVYYPVFDPPMLDDLRSEAAIDGFEAYYPVHTAEQTAMFVEYAGKHDLLVSSGSDSHGANRKPIPYPAHSCRKLLERLGVAVR